MALTTFVDPTRPLDGRVHVDGTDTEYAAARANREPRGQQRQAVLNRFREVGERGSTDFENFEALGFVRPHVAGTRREELIKDGWPIVDSGGRRPTDTGRPAIVWKLASLEEPQSDASGDESDRAHEGVGRGSSSDAALSESGLVSPASPSAGPDSQLALALPGSVYRKEAAA